MVDCRQPSVVANMAKCSPDNITPKSQIKDSERCSLFDSSEISTVFLNTPKGSNSYTMYFKIPGGVPGLEKNYSWDQYSWNYTATIGDVEAHGCNYQGYTERLYCHFTLPAGYANSTKPISLRVNGCDRDIYSHSRMSIPEPVAVAKPKDSDSGDSNSKTYCEQLLGQGESGFFTMDENECSDAGGVSFDISWCFCE